MAKRNRHLNLRCSPGARAIAVVVFWLTAVGAQALEEELAMGGEDAREDISQLILHWGYYRDHGLWDRLAETFHPDGEIQVTWYRGPFSGFVEASRAMAAGGSRSTHVMFPPVIDLQGERAIAITPVEIRGRASVALGVEVDMTSEARFFDFVEKRAGQWRILRRVCVYQKDRIDSVLPSLRFWLMGLFMPTGKFDPAYKHLGMVLEKAGFEIQPDQVVDNTAAARALYEEGQAWLLADKSGAPEGNHE